MRLRRSSGGDVTAANSIASSLAGAVDLDLKNAAKSRRFTSNQFVRGMMLPTSDPPADSSIQRGHME